MEELSSPETADRVREHLLGIGPGDLVSASVREMADSLGVGRETVHRALTRLIAEGRIKLARRGTGSRYPSVWEVR